MNALLDVDAPRRRDLPVAAGSDEKSRRPGRGRVAAYAIGLAVGLAAVALMLPPATVAGTGALWRWPGGDLAQNLTGHLAVQAPGWHWPPLLAPSLAWPHGMSAAMTDSNPLVSLVAKLLAGVVEHPVNLLGAWLAASWFLQPLAAVFAVRSFATDRPAPGRGPGPLGWEAALAAAVLAVTYPALLARYMHINLLGHFTLLLAIGLALRLAARPTARRWLAAGGVLAVAVLVQPYLFVFAAAVLAAPVVQEVASRRPGALRTAVSFLLAAAVPVAIYKLLSGTVGAGDRGFGYFSMNLLSPVWPQRSGLFGPELPFVDGTGGQYEGFNYLGAGGLLLVAAALVVQLRRPGPGWRRWWGLIVVLIALTLVALTPRVYAGRTLVLPLSIHPWDQVFTLVRSSGRAFWPVGYTLLLGAVACLSARLPRPWLGAALGAALLLQWLDTAPLRAEASAYFAGAKQELPAVALPEGAALVSVFPLCMKFNIHALRSDLIRLAALRDGAALGNIRASRLPSWFACETDLSDALETKLLPREVRVFLNPAAPLAFRQEALGPEAVCRDQAGYTLCARDLAVEGGPVPPGPALPTVTVPAALEGAEMQPLLSAGWRADGEGHPWSEGPRATLFFRPEGVPPGGAGLLLRLRLAGVARSPGGTRPIQVAVNGGPALAVDLRDLQDTELALPVPASALAGGTVRVTFDIYRPVDPATRKLAAPVRRAALRLEAVDLRPGGG
jgi:Family of unknown function (DUF6311)